MTFSAKVQYGVLALIELATDGDSPDRPFRAISELAQRCAVPEPYLLQVLLRLKTVGIVESRRGKTGGYRLGRATATIRLLHVVDALEGRPRATSESREGHPGRVALQRAAEKVQSATRSALERLTLRELGEWTKEAHGSGGMYHI